MKQKKTKMEDNPQKKPVRQRKKVAKQPSVPDTPTPSYELPEVQDSTKPPSFSRFIPNEDILSALENSPYQIPNEMLLKIIPAVLRGSDTLVFGTKQSEDFLIGAIPALSRFLYSEYSEKKSHSPMALFLFPSEESAKNHCLLTKDVFQNLKIQFDFMHADMNPHTDVLFATPGKIIDAQKTGLLNLDFLKILTVNELGLFDEESFCALDKFVALQSHEKIQKIFISYQNSPKIREFAFKYLTDPEIFYFLSQDITEQYPRQFAHALEATKKFQVLLGYLKNYKPRAALVVANTKTVAEWIAFKLHGNGIKTSLVTAQDDLTENRMKTLKAVSNGEINVFVATDFAIKNFGFESLNCIYHFDLPDNPTLFVHRLQKIIGARNPISIAFVCEDYGFNMNKIEKTLGFKIRVTVPDKNLFNFKDVSDYPLETDGRVKPIVNMPTNTSENVSQVNKEPVQQVERKVQQQNSSTKQTVSKTPQNPTKERRINNTTQSNQSEPLQQPIKTEVESSVAQKPSSHYQPDTSKFVRRDERAKEAVAKAVLAAKMANEKNKNTEFENKSKINVDTETHDNKDDVLSSLFFVVSDAIAAGLNAAKKSLSNNTADKFPLFHRLLNRRKKK